MTTKKEMIDKIRKEYQKKEKPLDKKYLKEIEDIHKLFRDKSEVGKK